MDKTHRAHGVTADRYSQTVQRTHWLPDAKCPKPAITSPIYGGNSDRAHSGRPRALKWSVVNSLVVCGCVVASIILSLKIRHISISGPKSDAGFGVPEFQSENKL